MAIPLTTFSTPAGVYRNILTSFALIFENVALTKKSFKSSSLSKGVNIASAFMNFQGLLNYIPGLSDLSVEYSVSKNPLPITKWETNKFPFANRQIAANGALKQPFEIELGLHNTLGDGTLALGLAKMEGLRYLFDAYTSENGTFTVVTPSQIYTGVILTLFQDDDPERVCQTFLLRFEVILTSLSTSFINNANPQIQRLEKGGAL